MKTERKRLGDWGEGLVLRYYLQNGFTLLGKQVRMGRIEIDLLFEKQGVLYSVEVKTRRTTSYGNPEDAVLWAKKQRLRRATSQFVAQQSKKFTSIHIQVAALFITKNGAFLRIYTVDE